MKVLRPTIRVRLLTASLAVPLLLQLLGLNVLCFCGHCPASQILLPSAPPPITAEHACCHHRDAAPEVAANVPRLIAPTCCGDDHAWRPTTAVHSANHAPLPQASPLLAWQQPPFSPDVPVRALASQPRFFARGPPPVPIYLQLHSLQI